MPRPFLPPHLPSEESALARENGGLSWRLFFLCSWNLPGESRQEAGVVGTQAPFVTELRAQLGRGPEENHWFTYVCFVTIGILDGSSSCNGFLN